MVKNSSALDSQLYTCFKTEIEIFKNLYELTKANASQKNVRKLRGSLRRLRTFKTVFINNKRAALTAEAESSFLNIWKVLGKQKKIDSIIQLASHHDFKVKRLKRYRKALKPTTQQTLESEKIGPLLSDLELMARYDSKLPPLDLKKTVIKIEKELKAVTELNQLRIILKKIRYLSFTLNLPTEDFKPFEKKLSSYRESEDLLKLVGKDDSLLLKLNDLRQECLNLESQIIKFCQDKLDHLLFMNVKLKD